MRNGIQFATLGVLSLWFPIHVAATTVLVFVSPQEAVIATDSLSNRMEGGQRFVCKVAQVSEHMLFVATGTGSTENPHFNPYELARINSMNGRSPREAAIKYSSEALPTLQTIWRLNRSRYFDIGAINSTRPTGPQDFLFIGLNQNGLISASGSSFVEDPESPPRLRVNEIHEFAGEHAEDIFLYKSGVVESLPSDKEINRWIWTIGATAGLKRAIEIQIKATPKLVGGKISVVRLRRDGSISWVEQGICLQPNIGSGIA